MNKIKTIAAQALLSFVAIVFAISCSLPQQNAEITLPSNQNITVPENPTELETVLNNNVPAFSEEDYEYAKSTGYFIELSELDELGRTGVTWGLFDYKHMPTKQRGPLKTNPSGWVQNTYDTSIVSGGYLYNRSHQIGFQISGLNDEPRNLMTGTRLFNAPGMLKFEDMTASHIREEREHHVLYRVTPDFRGNNLLAHGVVMESDCLECDDSADYCVYIANIQPKITIDYATGKNWLSTEEKEDPSILPNAKEYVINTTNNKFHLPTCHYAESLKPSNREDIKAPRDWMLEKGYTPCGFCKP